MANEGWEFGATGSFCVKKDHPFRVMEFPLAPEWVCKVAVWVGGVYPSGYEHLLEQRSAHFLKSQIVSIFGALLAVRFLLQLLSLASAVWK